MDKEEFLERYRARFPLRDNHPAWVDAQRHKFKHPGAHATVSLTHQVIGGLYERFVVAEGWTQKAYCLALEECFLAGNSLTRAQVEKGRAAAEAKGLIPKPDEA